MNEVDQYVQPYKKKKNGIKNSPRVTDRQIILFCWERFNILYLGTIRKYHLDLPVFVEVDGR